MWCKNTPLEDDLVKLNEFRSRHPNAEEVENCVAWSHWVSGEYDCDLLPTEAGFFCHSCGEEIASEEHYRICLSLSVDDLSEIVVSYPVVAALREAEVGHSSAFDDSRHPTDEDIYQDGYEDGRVELAREILALLGLEPRPSDSVRWHAKKK